MQLINDIKPREIYSAYVVGPFDQTLKVLESQDYKLISLEETARLRMQEGKDHDVSRVGNRVKEGVLYVPGEGRFITRNSAVLDNPRKATQSHRNGKEYFVSDNQVRRVLEDSIQIPYKVNEILQYPIDRSSEDKIAMFCFGENAKDYELFLSDAGILKMPLELDGEDYVQKQGKPYANQLWLGGLDYGSKLNGIDKYLHRDFLSRGIFQNRTLKQI